MGRPKGVKNKCTPVKAKAHGAVEYMQAKGIDFSHMDVFEHFNIGKTTGWKYMKDEEPARTVSGDSISQLQQIADSESLCRLWLC